MLKQQIHPRVEKNGRGKDRQIQNMKDSKNNSKQTNNDNKHKWGKTYQPKEYKYGQKNW